MEEKKNANQTNELKDEELDAVSGGLSRRPKQQQMKQCALHESDPRRSVSGLLRRLPGKNAQGRR